MRIKIQSLGCRLNQAEIQSVSTRLQEAGHEIVSRGHADAFIINSCSVTVISERKTRKLLYQAMRDSEPEPEALIILTGCGAGEERREGNTFYLSNDNKYRIPEIIENRDLFDTFSPGDANRFGFHTPVKSTRTRVNIKIQDGCDNYCSYCIIPYVRGNPVCNPAPRVLDECRELLDAGYKELILTGVMVGNYHDGETAFDTLVEKILNLNGTFRLHLSSLSPQTVTKKLISLADHEKLVRHLSLSLQSGSDAVLRAMNRRYTRNEYLALIEAFRKKDPDFNFTTDLIVGFPGETEADFEDSLALIKEAAFSHIHTFRYSPRPGTAAAEMSDTVPEETKKERSRRVIDLYLKQKDAYYSRFYQKTSVFISERAKKGVTRGFNEYYIPVSINAELPHNRFYRIVTEKGENPEHLEASVVEELHD